MFGLRTGRSLAEKLACIKCQLLQNNGKRKYVLVPTKVPLGFSPKSSCTFGRRLGWQLEVTYHHMFLVAWDKCERVLTEGVWLLSDMAVGSTSSGRVVQGLWLRFEGYILEGEGTWLGVCSSHSKAWIFTGRIAICSMHFYSRLKITTLSFLLVDLFEIVIGERNLVWAGMQGKWKGVLNLYSGCIFVSMWQWAIHLIWSGKSVTTDYILSTRWKRIK